jgi:hypothetical protein
VKDLYNGNKTLMKKYFIKIWKDIPCFGAERRINTEKMTILAKVIYRFNTISIKMPMTFFTEIEKKKSQNSYGGTKDQNSQSTLKGGINAVVFTIPDLKT